MLVFIIMYIVCNTQPIRPGQIFLHIEYKTSSTIDEFNLDPISLHENSL